jgi:hypothetical protein
VLADPDHSVPNGRIVKDEQASGQRKLRPTGAPEGCACYPLSVAPGVSDCSPCRGAGSDAMQTEFRVQASRFRLWIAMKAGSRWWGVGDEERLIQFGKAEQPDDHRGDIGQDEVAMRSQELVVARDKCAQPSTIHKLELRQVQTHKPMTEPKMVVQDGSEQSTVRSVQIAPHMNHRAASIG